MTRLMIGSAIALTLTALPLRAAAQGWSPALEIRVLSSSPEGTTVPASGRWKMVQGGEPLAKTVAVGASLCTVGIAGADMPPSRGPHGTIWKLTGEYLGEEAGRHSVRVTSRFVKLAGQESAVSTTQPLSLRDGDAVILDAVSAALDGSCPVHTLAMEARLVMLPDDPALAEARYTADLWFVHTGPDGEERRQRLIANVDGSAAAPFLFHRLRFAVPQIEARQGDAEATIQLAGTLRVRPRADGQIDLDIDTDPFIFSFQYPGTRSRPAMSRRRKTVTVKVDETTAIDFPLPGSGMISLMLPGSSGSGLTGAAVGASGAPAAPDGPVLEIVKDRLVLHTARFFKGHRTQLLIRLRKGPAGD